jgi:hypothetical protein
MTDTYVVVAQVGGFTKRNRDDKIALLERESEARVVDTLIRDDGTAELCVRWEPEAEADGTQSFEQAKDSLEAVRSAITGAGLTHLNPLTVELRDVAKAQAQASGAKAKGTTKASPRR